MIRKENRKLLSRIMNYKFRSAQKHLEGESKEVVETVNALAQTFGNCGWINGNMEIIVQTCVAKICPEIEEY